MVGAGPGGGVPGTAVRRVVAEVGEGGDTEAVACTRCECPSCVAERERIGNLLMEIFKLLQQEHSGRVGLVRVWDRKLALTFREVIDQERATVTSPPEYK